MKRILVINGNSKEGSLSHGLADHYAQGANDAGHDVEVVHLSALAFQAVARTGYDNLETLEPDLQDLQEKIRAATHLVFVYPIWWGTVPALLKGALDRILLPNFAFKYQKGNPFPKKLLTGKTARLIVTMDTPPWYYKLIQGAPAHKMMKRTVLEFCGVKPVKITEFGPVIGSKESKRHQWLQQAKGLGRNAA